jgi:hypothetical protein
VYEVPDSSLAIIRYVKGQSDLTNRTARMFRSVVWNTETNKPVSVTPFKSHDGMVNPAMLEALGGQLYMEEFMDGVMIGQFYDQDSQRWRIHTRSTMDANCRYYSKEKTFAELFQETISAKFSDLAVPFEDMLDKSVSYTWVLTHMDNRVVVTKACDQLTLVQMVRILPDAKMQIITHCDSPLLDAMRPRRLYTEGATMGLLNISEFSRLCGKPEVVGSGQNVPADRATVVGMIREMLQNTNAIPHTQGFVIKRRGDATERWKIRTPSYQRVRRLRGNTARLDFHWMDLWSNGKLDEYLKYYGEDCIDAMHYVNGWKNLTTVVYKLYVEYFKARTGDRSNIPAKYRPLVYGLHNLYLTELKPAHRSLDWRETVRWMNSRDTAQKVFVLNWDLRQSKSAAARTIPRTIPIEPSVTQPPAAVVIDTTSAITADSAATIV